MSISITNSTTNDRFEHLHIRVRGTNSPTRDLVIPKDETVEYDDKGSEELRLILTTLQSLRGEINLVCEVEYLTDCNDYILEDFKNEILRKVENGRNPDITRMHTIILSKEDTCPEDRKTHINVNIKHPPVGGGG